MNYANPNCERALTRSFVLQVQMQAGAVAGTQHQFCATPHFISLITSLGADTVYIHILTDDKVIIEARSKSISNTLAHFKKLLSYIKILHLNRQKIDSAKCYTKCPTFRRNNFVQLS